MAVFASNYSVSDCVSMVSNIGSVGPNIAADTDWLARKLSGMDAEDGCDYEVADDDAVRIVSAVHRKTPNSAVVRFSAFAHIQELEGLSRAPRSKKGKKTKAATLRELLLRVGEMQLFKGMSDENSFAKLRVDHDRMKECMETCGGREAFGGWEDWGDVFQTRDSCIGGMWLGWSRNSLLGKPRPYVANSP